MQQTIGRMKKRNKRLAQNILLIQLKAKVYFSSHVSSHRSMTKAICKRYMPEEVAVESAQPHRVHMDFRLAASCYQDSPLQHAWRIASGSGNFTSTSSVGSDFTGTPLSVNSRLSSRAERSKVSQQIIQLTQCLHLKLTLDVIPRFFFLWSIKKSRHASEPS